MKYYCVEREKTIRHENNKPQTVTVIKIVVCGFEVCSCVVNLVVISQYITDLSESNQSAHGFFTCMDSKREHYD